MTSKSLKVVESSDLNFQEFLRQRKKEIENFLDDSLVEANSAKKLWQAMKYSALNGGKRLRGILCLAACETVDANNWRKALPLAAGIECIHAMSLIHDDLPCMDNDTLRRGKPTCHIAFDEATALLAGDALLVEGINLCLKSQLKPEILVAIIQELTLAIGAHGMTGGQSIDLEQTDKDNTSLLQLEEMHKLKTGAFLRASVIMGGLAAEANENQLNSLIKYSENIGLAFQIVDDLLDLGSDSQTLGKTVGKDLAQNKATYPRLLGLEESSAKARSLIDEAKNFLLKADLSFRPLFQIADYIIERKY